MSTTVILRLPERPDRPFQWTTLSTGGLRAQPTSGAELELSQAAAGRRLVVLVPGTRVLLTRAQVPARRSRQLQAAVPFALEESLAGDVEDLQFALGERDEEGATSVAVVARAALDGWLARLQELGLKAEAVVPEPLALPFEPGRWSVWVGAGEAVVRTGPQSGFATDPELLEPLLRLALEEAGEAAPEILRLHSAAAEPPALGVLPGVTVERAGASEPLLALATPGREAIDLLQGDYSPRQQWGKLWRPWIPSAALLLVWLGLQAGLAVADLVRLQSEVASQGAAIEQIFRDTFPGERLQEPRIQMEQQLRALRAAREGDAFLVLMEESAAGFAKVPDLRLQQISFNDGQLDLQLSLPRLELLDGLKQALQESGLSAEVVTANSAADGVQARLRIRKGAP